MSVSRLIEVCCQDVVRFANSLELLSGFLVTRVLIGVRCKSELDGRAKLEQPWNDRQIAKHCSPVCMQS